MKTIVMNSNLQKYKGFQMRTGARATNIAVVGRVRNVI